MTQKTIITLDEAIQEKDLEATQRLIQEGANINRFDDNSKKPPLVMAIDAHWVEGVSLLISHHVDLNLPGYPYNALTEAIMCLPSFGTEDQSKAVEITNLLLDHNAPADHSSLWFLMRDTTNKAEQLKILERLVSIEAPWSKPYSENTLGTLAIDNFRHPETRLELLAKLGPVYSEYATTDEDIKITTWGQLFDGSILSDVVNQKLLTLLLDNNAHLAGDRSITAIGTDASIILAVKPEYALTMLKHKNFPLQELHQETKNKLLCLSITNTSDIHSLMEILIDAGADCNAVTVISGMKTNALNEAVSKSKAGRPAGSSAQNTNNTVYENRMEEAVNFLLEKGGDINIKIGHLTIFEHAFMSDRDISLVRKLAEYSPQFLPPSGAALAKINPELKNFILAFQEERRLEDNTATVSSKNRQRNRL